jgi:thymidylate synthase
MATGRKPGKLVMFLADVHIYVNHMDQVIEQLNRNPYELPKLKIPTEEELGFEGFNYLVHIDPSDISLEDYVHHPAIKAPMAV